jgi:predicted amidophosphoribosyltransferase
VTRARAAAGRLATPLSLLLDALLPPSCPACRTPLEPGEPAGLLGLCESCRGTVSLAAPGCARCGDPGGGAGATCEDCLHRPPAYARLRGALAYGGAARDLLLAFKHGRDWALARPLGTLAAATALREGLLEGCEIVVPVAAWPARLVSRGYSPPALLARVVARRAGVPWDPACLVRVRPPGEAHASRDARWRQVRGAFAVRHPERVAGRRVLVVDDVAATGATADDVARALRQAGAAAVDVVAVARSG